MNRNKINLTLPILALLLATGPSLSARAEPPPTFKVITYNVQFLPKMVRKLNKRPDVEYRAEAIAQRLSRYDLISLNEAFDQEPRDQLLAKLKSSFGNSFHQALPPENTESGLGIGSGLAVVSRFPMIQSQYLRFGSSGRPLKGLLFADGAAAKGALYVRIRNADTIPPCDADVFVTHLESKDAGVRSQQYQALGKFIGKNKSASRPVLLLGDLNTKGDEKAQQDPNSSYHRMLKSFQEHLPDHVLQDVWVQLGEGPGITADWDEGGGDRLDYVLVANPKSGASQLQAQSIRVNQFTDEKVVTLSDHYAVEAEFQWQLQN